MNATETETRKITYQSGPFIVYGLTATEDARMATLSLKAEAAYLCGETVMQVYVSDLSLEREEFKVCVGADFEEIKRMTQGHMQVADLCKLGS